MRRAALFLAWTVPAAAVAQLDAPRRIEEIEQQLRPLGLVSHSHPATTPTPSAGPGEALATGRTYTPLRTEEPIRVDGVLDEPIWGKAPKDERFLSWLSNPFGGPTTAPTLVQVAYDSENLYVAFRCQSPPASDADTGPPSSEYDILTGEFLAVFIDANQDHTTAKVFMVSRGGYRGDFEMTGTNDSPANWRYNFEWRGDWHAAVHPEPDGWTAELQIPWATLRIPTPGQEITLGINFGRSAPPEFNEWSLSPPGYDTPKPSHYGQMTFGGEIRPGGRVYLAPSLSGIYDQAATRLEPLRNFPQISGPVGLYGGLYGRVRPGGPLQIDLAVNPDFLGAPPDPTVSATDRFELYYPEQRDFFLENKTSLDVGLPDYQLFYSRRIGLVPGPVGYDEVPLLYGLKARVQAGDTEATVLNTATSDPNSLRLTDVYTVARGQHFFAGGDRVGAIFIDRGILGSLSEYRAYGADGQVAFIDQHLRFSGFAARSDTQAAPSGYVGNAAINWTSQSLTARASYLDVGSTFDPQLGYFILTGVQQTEMEVGYTVLLSSDLVNRIKFDGLLTRTTDRSDALLIDRKVAQVYMLMTNGGDLGLSVTDSRDTVVSDFSLAGGRFGIATGGYPSLTSDIFIDTPPGRLIGAFDYTEGTFWGGYRRSLIAQARLRLGLLNGSLRYQLTQLRTGDGTELFGHRATGQLVIAYTPEFRTTLFLDVNTLDPAAVGEVVTSYNFGHLSSVLLVLSEKGSTLGAWLKASEVQVALKLTYGLQLF